MTTRSGVTMTTVGEEMTKVETILTLGIMLFIHSTVKSRKLLVVQQCGAATLCRKLWSWGQ